MRDVFDYTAPFGLLPAVASRVFLTGYMRRFLLNRNRTLVRLAVSKAGERYVRDGASA